MEILMGWGSQKPKFLRERTGLKWISRGVGGSNQKPTVGKVWMFSGATHFRFACFIISGYDDCSEKYNGS